LPPTPLTVERSSRAFTSSVRGHVIVAGSMSSGLPKYREASIAEARRLCAAVTAWKSPLKCRLMSSIGTTCAYPPPVPPPLMLKTGPIDGSRRHNATLLPIAQALEHADRHLGAVRAVWLDLVGNESRRGRDLRDGTQDGLLGDLESGLHGGGSSSHRLALIGRSNRREDTPNPPPAGRAV